MSIAFCKLSSTKERRKPEDKNEEEEGAQREDRRQKMMTMVVMMNLIDDQHSSVFDGLPFAPGAFEVLDGLSQSNTSPVMKRNTSDVDGSDPCRCRQSNRVVSVQVHQTTIQLLYQKRLSSTTTTCLSWFTQSMLVAYKKKRQQQYQ